MVMTRDNTITNRLVRQGRLPKSMLEVYPNPNPTQKFGRKAATGTWSKPMPKSPMRPMGAISDAEKRISNMRKLSAGTWALSNKEFKILKRKAKAM